MLSPQNWKAASSGRKYGFRLADVTVRLVPDRVSGLHICECAPRVRC